MNKVILIGRLTKDPELRATAAGVPVCSFTVACDRRYVKQGEERKADFINCVAWQNHAETISKYFTKGQRIALEGNLQVRSWQGNDSKTYYATEVHVENWEFAQSKAEGQQTTPAQNETATAGKNSGNFEDFTPIEDSDLPF